MKKVVKKKRIHVPVRVKKGVTKTTKKVVKAKKYVAPTKKIVMTKNKAKKDLKVASNKTAKIIKKKANIKTKKTVKRKTSKKAKINKTLIFAFGDQCFWIKDGPILRDLIDLRNVLYEITQEQFDYHVDAIKNDFASWVEYVLEDEHTSEIIRKAKSAKAMIDAIHKSLPKHHRR